jgi:hypothetical protein
VSGQAGEDEMIQALASALKSGASVTFTHGSAGSTVTVTCHAGTFTAHGPDAYAALQRVLAALSAR